MRKPAVLITRILQLKTALAVLARRASINATTYQTRPSVLETGSLQSLAPIVTICVSGDI